MNAFLTGVLIGALTVWLTTACTDAVAALLARLWPHRAGRVHSLAQLWRMRRRGQL